VFVAAVVIAAIVVTRLGTLSVRRLQRRMEAAHTAKQELALQRASTVAHALNYAVRVTVWTIALLMILGKANIELGPLVAGAGVAGVALGFGAQSIVRDYLAGFYLLIEDQLDVGDVVDMLVGGTTLSGRVTELTLRTTSLRTDQGRIHIVPNGGIAYVTNHSRGEGEVEVEVRLRDDEHSGDVRAAVDALLADVRRDPGTRLAILDGPWVGSVEPTGDGVAMKVVARARPDRRDDVAAMLRERLEGRLRTLPTDVDVRVDRPPDAAG
jgi:small conductance mechanosensitive channel